MNRFIFCCCVLVMLFSCRNKRSVSTVELTTVTDSVTRMMTRISADITKGGPTQWLTYFEDDPGFFMASDGAVKFSDFHSASTYTRDTLPRIMSRISLTWTNLRVDPLNREYASIGADFSEDISLTNGQSFSIAGFFTAIAHFNGTAWKLRNLNWATKPQTKTP